MSDSPTLDKLVVVSPRFARSVSLVRDAHRHDAIDSYILTPTGRDVLRRLADALCGVSSTRAWSLTGPYGGCDPFTWGGRSMIRRWIIAEVVDGGQSAFICEHRGELYLTRRRAEAVIY